MPKAGAQQQQVAPRSRYWRGIVSLECAGAGYLVALTVVQVQALDDINDPESISHFIAILSAFGGALAGLILSGWYGREGIKGWVLAGLASLLAAPLAGAMTAVCLIHGKVVIIAAGLALYTFASPYSLILWLICFLAIHLHARKLRTGRWRKSAKTIRGHQ